MDRELTIEEVETLLEAGPLLDEVEKHAAPVVAAASVSLQRDAALWFQSERAPPPRQQPDTPFWWM